MQLRAAYRVSCEGRECTRHLEGRVSIFESTGRFMGRWEDLFSTLDIPHLRSPHTAHPSCTHTQALMAHAKATRQTDAFRDLEQLRYNVSKKYTSPTYFRASYRVCLGKIGCERTGDSSRAVDRVVQWLLQAAVGAPWAREAPPPGQSDTVRRYVSHCTIPLLVYLSLLKSK